ncbi:preprotein translocase subunit SecG [Candidatus Pseudomonas adelgestsugas]|uniref:Protein-export membrane protein SecG n=1 Tax=Candidatus Pseudomonas adelgestsugas TaxID=1302376 RepID=A0ABX5R8Q7_9PSED|nr:preprotein translocase subunit SecG [Candidatus Pseudomonas adelgestsugas]QAX81723.1 Protein-export membrane protein SecG [Candidatus Pseudomonas adelgestsugas]
MLETVVVIFHMLTSIGIVALVLLQHGNSADTGMSFGISASNSIFRSQGSSTFLSKITAVLAAGLFITSLGLNYFAKKKADALAQIGLPSQIVLDIQKTKPVSDEAQASK